MNDNTELEIIRPNVSSIYDLNLDDVYKLIEQMGLENKNTELDYKHRIPLFVHYYMENGWHHYTLIRYKEMLDKRSDWSVSTKNKYFVAAKKLAKAYYNMGLSRWSDGRRMDITINQITQDNIKGFKTNDQLKKYGVSQKEAEKIADYLRNLPDTPENSRIKAMMALFLLQGLRQIEVSRLDVSDINFKDKTAKILGKGRDDYEIILLHNNTVALLEHYMKMNNLKSGPLFPSKSNRTLGERMSTRRVREIVKNTYRTVGVDDRSTHDMRHYFATALYRQTKDPREVQKRMRHKSFVTTMKYCDEVDTRESQGEFEAAFNTILF